MYPHSDAADAGRDGPHAHRRSSARSRVVDLSLATISALALTYLLLVVPPTLAAFVVGLPVAGVALVATPVLATTRLSVARLDGPAVAVAAAVGGALVALAVAAVGVTALVAAVGAALVVIALRDRPTPAP